MNEVSPQGKLGPIVVPSVSLGTLRMGTIKTMMTLLDVATQITILADPIERRGLT